jgi:nucleotide-binding universal stress UspA family protein
MKILIAYDGSICAGAALKDLERAGLPDEVEALVLSVAEERVAGRSPSGDKVVAASHAGNAPTVHEGKTHVKLWQAVEKAQAMATLASERIRSRFPLWTVRGASSYGSPAGEVIKKAEEWMPDLIVVGSHGRSAIGRFILGSVSQKVLTEARSSVRVGRSHNEDRDSPVRIVIGVDGSASSDMAVQVVAGRSWPAGSEARLVTSVEPFHQYGLEPEVKMSRVRDIHTLMQMKLREAGLVFSSIIREDDPKVALIKEAEACRADTIFIGARGLKGIKRFLLGSVSSSLAASATCSVEVVRL